MFMNNLLIAALCIVGCNAGACELLTNQSFAGYVAAHGKGYLKGSFEYKMREELFNERMSEIMAHNAAGHSWKKGVNQFTDWTEDELQSLRGYRRQHVGYRMPGGSSVVELSNVGDETPAEKPSGSTESMDWTQQLATSREVLSQGACGSCWAVAAAAVIQLHAAKEFKNFNQVLSPENINKCAPNPLECGGTGGCGGSTPGLAFEYVKSLGSSGGLYPLAKLPYTASTGTKITEEDCSNPVSFLQIKTHMRAKPSVSIQNYVHIEDNHAEKVMDALVTKGPLAVAVVGGGIQSYKSGVMSGCESRVVDHAVVMMGFGHDADSGLKYWNIRNSWGKHWGEDGFFRLQRHFSKTGASTGTSALQTGAEPCGWDNDPAKGVACKDPETHAYPKQTWVCGECGIISDVAYPSGIHVHDALLSTVNVASVASNFDAVQ